MAAMASRLDKSQLSEGKTIDGAMWTPLYLAYVFNCQDVGRSLVRRGASTGIGGRDGLLLVEVATQRVLNPDPKNSTINQVWAGILTAGLIDVDASAGGNFSNREGWSRVQGTGRVSYPEVWSRFEERTVGTPVVADNTEYEPDLPSSSTGITRPAEHTVSKGVEQAFKIYKKTGMAGLQADIDGCYQWALKITKPTGKRVALEHCAAIDIVARDLDASVARNNRFPPTPFFRSDVVEKRIEQIRAQQFPGLAYPVYRRNLEASINAWANFYVDLMLATPAKSK